MSEPFIEIRELQKKLTGFQEIPKGDVNVAYVFFQSRDNARFVITTEKKKIMAAELRIGKYDRVMTIHRGEFETVIPKKIACEEDGHWFHVTLCIKYYIREPEYIFIHQVYEIDQVLEQRLSGMEFELGGCFGFGELAKFEKAVWERTNKEVEPLDYLTINFKIKIELDETAQTILDRDRQHEIIERDTDLTAMEVKARTENEYDLEQLRLEKDKEIQRLKFEVQNYKVNSLGDLFKQYGANAGNLISLAEGEISGKEISRILSQKQKDQRDDNYNKILQLYKEGVISDDIVNIIMTQMVQDGMEGSQEGQPGIGIKKPELEGENQGCSKDQGAAAFPWDDSETGDGTVE